MNRTAAAFTLLEMLVATAVFSMLVVVLLSLTSSMLTQSTRVDENAEADRDVRIFFDLLRRDLAQARIGTNKNFFRGESNRLFFVSSSSRLKPEYVSDSRLISYSVETNSKNILCFHRAVVDPVSTNTNWSPGTNGWWNNTNVYGTDCSEEVLEGVRPHTNTNGVTYDYFTYIGRNGAPVASPTATNSPPSGVVVSFQLLTKSAKKRLGTNVAQAKEADVKAFKYDIELNITPPYDP